MPVSAALGLGLAGLNTGNNLVYLLCSLLLALILVSAILSEYTLGGFACGPCCRRSLRRDAGPGGAYVANRKRRLPSLLADPGGARGRGRRPVLHFPRLDAGEERLATWTTTFPAPGAPGTRRGRLATRFPFGLFTKSEAVGARRGAARVPRRRTRGARTAPRRLGCRPVPRRRRGRGDDLYDLRPYLPGDDPRMIHWRSSARAQLLTVREQEAEATHDVRIVLDRRRPSRARPARGGRLRGGLARGAPAPSRAAEWSWRGRGWGSPSAGAAGRRCGC